jgi:2-iminobutanoate/2-iminopropanoate deaminase
VDKAMRRMLGSPRLSRQGKDMKKAIETGIPRHNRPFEWAIVADNILYTAAAPLRADGTPETGDITTQATLTLANLAKVLKAAGGSMADVTQVMLYVTKREYIDPITLVWAKAFPKPYPNRATVIVSEIGIRDIGLVIMAHAHLGSGKKKAPARKVTRAAQGSTRNRRRR